MNSENVFFYSILSFIGMVGIFIAFMVIRYLNRKALAMQTILDQMINDRIYLVSVDESLVKRIARSFVTFTSIFSILISDLESTGIYQLMSITTGKVQKYGFNELFIIAAINCLIILIVTQYQIEMFRKSVDLRGRLRQL